MSEANHSLTEQRELAMSLLDSDERRDATRLLIDEYLPEVAAEIENIMFSQGAKLSYELIVEQLVPLVRTTLKLKKLSHDNAIVVNSKKAMFIVGSERGGQHADSPQQAALLLKQVLLKFKTD